MRLTPRSALLFFAVSLIGLLPEAARAQEHAEMLQSFGPRFVVFREKVQDELKLTTEQKSKLNSRAFDFVQDAQEFFMGLQDAKPEERQKKHMEFAQKANAKLDTLLKDSLKDDQIKRLRQIELQMEGLFAIGKPEISKELKITDEQRKQFMEVVQSLQQKVEPIVKQMQEGGDPNELRPKMMKVRMEHDRQIDAFLTEAQKAQWKEMTGKPFSLGE
jgi:hypothetical protein